MNLPRDCVMSIPGEYDLGLVEGGALGVLAALAAERLSIHVPAVGEPWDDRDGCRRTRPFFILFGPRAEVVVAGATSALQRVAPGRDVSNCLVAWPVVLPHAFTWPEGSVLVPANGLVRVVTVSSSVDAKTLERLHSIATLPGTRIAVRFNEPGAALYRRQMRRWSHEKKKPELVSTWLDRWLGVAALLALWRSPERPIITADDMVSAEEVAFTSHDLACVVMKEQLVEVPSQAPFLN